MPSNFFSKLVKPNENARERSLSASAAQSRPEDRMSRYSSTTASTSSTLGMDFNVIPPSPNSDVHPAPDFQGPGSDGAITPTVSSAPKRPQPQSQQTNTTITPGLGARSSSLTNLSDSYTPPSPLPSPPPLAPAPSKADRRERKPVPDIEMPLHGRSATMPAHAERSSHNTAAEQELLVESPKALRSDFGSSPTFNALADSSTLLKPIQDSDAISIGSSTSKRRAWRRPSFNNSSNNGNGNNNSSNATPKGSSGNNNNNKQRQATATPAGGIAAALAASGMSIAGSAVNMTQHPHHQHSRHHEMSPPGDASLRGRRGSGAASTNGGPSSRKTSIHSTGRHAHGPEDAQSEGAQNGRRGSVVYSEHSYDSGDDDDDDDSSGGSSESENDDIHQLLHGEQMPVTGFAVASSKRNADFHELFPTVPEGDYLIEDYGCALQRDILVQGRLYISENFLCFHANIFGWVTDLIVPMAEITALEKKMTAFVIPNAIGVSTRTAKYTFASFLSRETTYDVIHNIWRLARPEGAGSGSNGSGNGVSARGSLDEARSAMEEHRDGVSAAAAAAAASGSGGGKPGVKTKAAVVQKQTMCSCSKDGKHLNELVLEAIFPGTPENIHNLMFASGFIKDFMTQDQKLFDLQISDWTPTSPGSKLLARNMSYTKPLSAPVGPKQTRCELRDETVFCDFDNYISTETTTRTPEVPSGNAFSVETRTCIMWASAVSSRIIVTTQVNWTGRSFIKGIIEKSAIDGQRSYHLALEKAMRNYVTEHKSEFVPAGMEDIGEPEIIASPTVEAGNSLAAGGAAGTKKDSDGGVTAEGKERERERHQRTLQWAYDTFAGAASVARQSTRGALELVGDAWDQSNSTTIAIFLIIGLIISNLWTLHLMGSREEVGRRKEMRKTEEKEKWVQGIVTALWDELGAAKNVPPVVVPLSSGGVNAGGHSVPTGPIGELKDEVADMVKTLDAVEARIRQIKEVLAPLNEID